MHTTDDLVVNFELPTYIELNEEKTIGYIYGPYLGCTGTVGNFAPYIKTKSRYAVQNINMAYYTKFNVNKNL